MSLYIACFLTIVTETGFFCLCGYKDRDFVTVCACVNAATNLPLNLLLGRLDGAGADVSFWVYPLECLVILAEYWVYTLIEGRSKKLFGLTAAANVLSYGLGLFLFGHV
jgi:hypothetical protein